MGNNFLRTRRWLQNCGKEPSPENLSVQIGCHIEEMCEFLRTLECVDMLASKDLRNAIHDLEYIGSLAKSRTKMIVFKEGAREAALDALCDADVTGNGVAYLAGMNKALADLMVLKAHDEKLVDGKPVILPGGKIGKPEGWKPPDLSPYV
jgi:predicted HAD superfamily Cof-like phosphohydrolase